MIRALKVTLIVWGVLGILFGLAFILTPRELGQMVGYSTEGPKYMLHFLASQGIFLIAPSVFLIAAARDPLRHIYWVKFAILEALLMIVIDLYSVSQGYVGFGQAGTGIILNAVFAAAFLAFYPWRVARTSQ